MHVRRVPCAAGEPGARGAGRLVLLCGRLACDKLGAALIEVAAKHKIEVEVVSLDIERGCGQVTQDLSDLATINKIKEDVRKGRYQGAHAGFPCSSFSKLRHPNSQRLTEVH